MPQNFESLVQRMLIFQLVNKLKYWKFIKAPSALIVLGVITSVFLYSTTANAAEQVVLKYGNFRGTVSFRELSQFVETGKTTPTLKAYLQAAQQDPPSARKALVAGIKAEPAFLNNLLSSWAGPILLNQLGQAVHPPSQQSDEQALRLTLTKSVNQDGEVTLLDAIQNYPAKSVEIEGDRLVSVYQKLNTLAKAF